ncbi:MAG: cysteine desulfurase family protein [Thermodesulfovibrionales bacterium]
MIYLDYNATTPLDPLVKNAVIRSVDLFGNPSSLHRYGRESNEAIELSRNKLASLIKCETGEIYFTSGGTESNNIAIIGLASRHRSGHIITSSIEHPAVMKPLEILRKSGYETTSIPVAGNGVVSADDVLKAIRKDTILITVMHANNETGALQPIKEISEIARGHDITFHTDAAQTTGKIEVDIKKLGVDMMSIASHKFYGPKGIGAIYIKNGMIVNPVIHGAFQEKGISPGTENIIGISGFGVASEIAANEISDRMEHTRTLRDLLFSGLSDTIKGLHINSEPGICLPNTLNISIKDILANDLVSNLRDKIAFSAGAACHEGRHEPSHVLKAMGISDEDAVSSIRLSLGKFNTEDEIKESITNISSSVNELRGY